VGAILLIFGSCELFVNSIEWLGRKLHISESAVGTVLAAIGTALPESMVTLIALVFSHGTAVDQDIGIGAIVGGPLMLSTLAYFTVGLTTLVWRKKRMLGTRLELDQLNVARDVRWFLAIFGVAVAATLIPSHPIKVLVALCILTGYVVYALSELRGEAGEQRALEPLHFHRHVSIPDTWRVVAQVLLGTAGMIYGAHLFVDNLSEVAVGAGISAIVLSILLSPVATELPEVMNAALWVRQGKEDLAVGNVSGSMLVQAAVPCALGLAFSPWQLSLPPLLAVAAILVATLFVFAGLSASRLSAPRLLLNGLPYAALLVVFIAMG
jgi:cation:H+ antiporter